MSPWSSPDYSTRKLYADSDDCHNYHRECIPLKSRNRTSRFPEVTYSCYSDALRFRRFLPRCFSDSCTASGHRSAGQDSPEAKMDAAHFVNSVFHPAQFKPVCRQSDTRHTDRHQWCTDSAAGVGGRRFAAAGFGSGKADFSTRPDDTVNAMYEAAGSGFAHACSASCGNRQWNFKAVGLG